MSRPSINISLYIPLLLLAQPGTSAGQAQPPKAAPAARPVAAKPQVSAPARATEQPAFTLQIVAKSDDVVGGVHFESVGIEGISDYGVLLSGYPAGQAAGQEKRALFIASPTNKRLVKYPGQRLGKYTMVNANRGWINNTGHVLSSVFVSGPDCGPGTSGLSTWANVCDHLYVDDTFIVNPYILAGEVNPRALNAESQVNLNLTNQPLPPIPDLPTIGSETFLLADDGTIAVSGGWRKDGQRHSTFLSLPDLTRLDSPFDITNYGLAFFENGTKRILDFENRKLLSSGGTVCEIPSATTLNLKSGQFSGPLVRVGWDRPSIFVNGEAKKAIAIYSAAWDRQCELAMVGTIQAEPSNPTSGILTTAVYTKAGLLFKAPARDIQLYNHRHLFTLLGIKDVYLPEYGAAPQFYVSHSGQVAFIATVHNPQEYVEGRHVDRSMIILATPANVQPVPKPEPQHPCGNSYINTEYDHNNENYHYYPKVPQPVVICRTNEPGCTIDNVFKVMLLTPAAVAPVVSKPQTVRNCGVLELKTAPFDLLGYENRIQTVVDDSKHSITNYTWPGHMFYPGQVTRTIIDRHNGTIEIETSGEGTGDWRYLNLNVGQDVIWPQANEELRKHVRTNAQ